MMRKMLMALVAMFAMAGLVVAVEVTVVKYDKETKKLTVKEGDAEKTYTVSDKAKFTTTDFKGENAKESDLAAFEKRVGTPPKKGALKIDITTEGGKVTEAKWKAGGKKKDKN